MPVVVSVAAGERLMLIMIMNVVVEASACMDYIKMLHDASRGKKMYVGALPRDVSMLPHRGFA